MGHQRGKSVSHPATSLIKIEGVENNTDAKFYEGKVRYSFNRSRQERGGVRRRWQRERKKFDNSSSNRTSNLNHRILKLNMT